VAQENRPPRTFVEWVLQLLEERFPWLGTEEEMQVSGADTIDQLTDLHRELKRRHKNLSVNRSCLPPANHGGG